MLWKIESLYLALNNTLEFVFFNHVCKSPQITSTEITWQKDRKKKYVERLKRFFIFFYFFAHCLLSSIQKWGPISSLNCLTLWPMRGLLWSALTGEISLYGTCCEGLNPRKASVVNHWWYHYLLTIILLLTLSFLL